MASSYLRNKWGDRGDKGGGSSSTNDTRKESNDRVGTQDDSGSRGFTIPDVDKENALKQERSEKKSDSSDFAGRSAGSKESRA